MKNKNGTDASSSISLFLAFYLMFLFGGSQRVSIAIKVAILSPLCKPNSSLFYILVV